MTVAAQYYLPPYEECTLDFMRELLSGQRKVFKRKDIRMIKVPLLQELTTIKIMEQIVQDLEIQQYLPDLSKLKRPLNREYMYNVTSKAQTYRSSTLSSQTFLTRTYHMPSRSGRSRQKSRSNS